MFEVYVPRTRAANKKKDIPEVKISKQSIVLNKNARALMQADKLELAYDSDDNTIRIKKADGSGINLKKTKLFAKGFLDHFGISEKGKFPAEYRDDEQAFYAKVK
jgi:hypothetical protein